MPAKPRSPALIILDESGSNSPSSSRKACCMAEKVLTLVALQVAEALNLRALASK